MNTRRITALSTLVVLGALPLVLQGCAIDPGSTDDLAKNESSLRRRDVDVEPVEPVEKEPIVKDPIVKPPVDPTPAPVEPAEEGLETTVVESGDGWKKLHVSGTAIDENGVKQIFDKDIIVVEDKSKAESAPLPTFVKSELLAESQASSRQKLLSASALASNGQALAAPAPADDDEVTVIDPETAEAGAAFLAANGGSPSASVTAKPGVTASLWGSCDNYDKTFSKTISKTYNYDYTKTTESGAFTGTGKFNAQLVASGTGSVTVRVKRVQTYILGCRTYSASFKRAQFQGNVDVTGKANIDAKFERAWKWKHKVAQPHIGSISTAVGPVPIKINFSVPVVVGIDASAKATLKFDAAAVARGSLNYTCTSSSCSGSRNYSVTWQNGQSPSIDAQAQVKVSPYVYAGLHANYFFDSFAYAEVGIKARLDSDLWAYTGNQCGDADGDGVNEYVSAATLDAALAIDLEAKAGALGSDYGPWPYNLWNKRLGFWTLAGGSALTPMNSLSTPLLGGSTVTSKGSMRPCWPYNDQVKYRINWNDGTSEEFWSLAKTPFTKSRQYATFGNKIVSVTAVEDAKGRVLNRTSNDSITTSPIFVGTFEPVVLTAAATN
jgi:hypothetical protein